MSDTSEAMRYLLDEARATALRAGRDNIIGDVLWHTLLTSEEPSAHIIPAEDREAALITALDEISVREPVPDTNQEVFFGIDALAILGRADRLAAQMGYKVAEPQHLFLSLFSARFPAGEVLKRQGWVFETYRQAAQAAGIVPPITLTREPLTLAVKVPSAPSRFTRWLIGPHRLAKNTGDALGITLQAMHLGDYGTAVAAADAAFQMMPDEPECRLWLAEALVRAQRFEEALPHLLLCSNAFPEDAQAGFLYSFALLRSGRLEEAHAIDIELLKQHPNSEDALNNAGFGLAAMDRHGEAVKMYDKSLALKPDYDFALNNKGYSLHCLGRTDEGEALIHRSLTVNRGNAFAFRNLALIAASRGDSAGAYTFAQRAFDFYYREDFGSDIDHLARAEAQST